MRISDWSSDVCSSDLDEAQVYARENAGKRVQVDADALRALVRNLRGLNLTDARRIARHLIFRDGAIGHNDLPELNKLKFELLNRSGHLRFEFDTAHFADVAGLARLKTWVSHRRAAFMPATDASNGSSIVLDPPKGILLLGEIGRAHV